MQEVIAPPLDEEERQYLFDQRNSEHFRVFAKAITWAYSQEAARLVVAKQEELPRLQGKLQGLLMARGVIAANFGGAPTEEQLRNVIMLEKKTR